MNALDAPSWMDVLLYASARMLLALWMLASGLVALLVPRTRDPERPVPRVKPSRDQVQDLAGTLRAARASVIARERVAGRLHALACDIAALDPWRSEGGSGSRERVLNDALVRAYHEEFRLAFTPDAGRKAMGTRSFLERTAQVVERLEALRQNRQGEDA